MNSQQPPYSDATTAFDRPPSAQKSEEDMEAAKQETAARALDIGLSVNESIFAWTYNGAQYRRFGRAGLLAPSPDVFVSSGDIVQGELSIHRPSYSMTNRGLRLEQD
jgi:hypothetical protein